jgi:hypothetical protein
MHARRPRLAAQAPGPVLRARRPARSRWRGFAKALAIAFVVLLGVRALLPFAVGRYVNHVLAGMASYRGEVDGVRLNLWRGSYEIDGLRVFHRSESREPLVEMRRLDLSIQWSGLLHGRIVAEATCHHPIVYFTAGTPARAGQPGNKTGEDEPWALHLDELVPFELNRFVVRDGEIRYQDVGRTPPVDFYVTDVYVEAVNIANVRGEPGEQVLLAEVEAAGRPYGTAECEVRVRFDPLAEPLRLELDAAVRGLELTDLNDYLSSGAGVDAEAGTLDIYAEFATTDGRVEGYVKTLFEDMRLLGTGDIRDPGDAVQAVWEAIVAAAAVVLENQPYDRLATKVPLRGTTQSTSADVWTTVGGLLRNAFLVALGPALDDSIELRDMEVVVPAAGEPGQPTGDKPDPGAKEER